MNQLIGGLVTTGEIIDKIPTWPWQQGTLMSFVSVFLLPFIVRLVMGIIDQLGLLDRLLP